MRYAELFDQLDDSPSVWNGRLWGIKGQVAWVCQELCVMMEILNGLGPGRKARWLTGR